VEIVHVPIDDGYYEELQNVWRQEAGDESSIYDTYVRMLELLAPNFARAIETIADAPEAPSSSTASPARTAPGSRAPCSSGLPGVSVDDIADDYGLSADNIRAIIDPWADAAHDETERKLRLRIGSSRRR
jgi:hypothetical protein